ncbi:MAG: thioesterase family protein [Actinomycetes bacterium]
MRFHSKAHVRWDDLDAFGHANNSKYLVFVQEARFEMISFDRVRNGQRPILGDMVVGRAEIDYLLPIYVGGIDLDVAIWVTAIGNSSFALAYELSSEAGLHARVKTIQVAVDMETKRSRPLTNEERDFLQPYFETKIS